MYRPGISRALSSVSFGALALIVSMAGFVYIQWARPFAWEPMDLKNPQAIVGATTIGAGGSVRTTGEKCNNSPDAIAVTGYTYLVRIQPERWPLLIKSGAGAMPPGCSIGTWDNGIPADTPPGTYRIEGIQTAHDGAREQTAAFFSDEFEVVAP